MPLVSIVIPVYNTARYLGSCLDSLQRQTLRDIELICVDDGSTDDSLSILQARSKSDSRIAVLFGENASAGAARNRGLEMARGEYVMFLDSDDFFEPALVETLYTKAKENDLDIVVCKADMYKDQSGQYELEDRQVPPGLWNKLDGKIFCPRRDLPGGTFQLITGAPWNKMWKRSFIHKHHLRYQAITNCNDTYFVMASFLLAERVGMVDAVLVHWRIWSHSLTRGFAKHPLCFIDALEALADQVAKLPEDQALIRSFFNYCIEMITWRFDLLEQSIHGQVREAYQQRMESKLHLRKFVIDTLCDQTSSIDKALKKKYRRFLSYLGGDTTYLLPLDFTKSYTWRFLRKLPRLLSQNANAIILALAVRSEDVAKLEELKCELGTKCYLFRQRDLGPPDLKKISPLLAEHVVLPGLWHSRLIEAQDILRAVTQLSVKQALSTLTMRVLKYRKLDSALDKS